MRRELVVADFGEDSGWPTLARGWEIRVYRKREQPGPGELPNVGREAQTYLRHIVERYHELADVTAFVQGDPREHVSDLENRLRNAAGIVPFEDWGTRRVVDPLVGRRSHRGLDLEGCCRDVLRRPPPREFRFGAGACFSVTREAIRRRPRRLYERAERWAIESARGAWELERMWPLIFGATGVRSDPC